MLTPPVLQHHTGCHTEPPPRANGWPPLPLNHAARCCPGPQDLCLTWPVPAPPPCQRRHAGACLQPMSGVQQMSVKARIFS
eukprot:1157860-Pelagomonas_calceolata.AAC.1